MLNLIAANQRPLEVSKVSGIPIGWNRSVYNQREIARRAMFNLLESVRARYLLISYNSEGFITHEQFKEDLERLGKYESLETKYNTFRGSRNLRERSRHVTEYLYLVER
jgi:adenine-specific DNA-methyltransferase